MVKKLGKIAQWFFGGLVILLGLIMTMSSTITGTLIILSGILIFPPVTKRIPVFKGRKAAIFGGFIVLFVAGMATSIEQTVVMAESEVNQEQEKVVIPTTSTTDNVQEQEEVVVPITPATSNTQTQETTALDAEEQEKFVEWMKKAISSSEINEHDLKKWKEKIPEQEFFDVWKEAAKEYILLLYPLDIDSMEYRLNKVCSVYQLAYGKNTQNLAQEFLTLGNDLTGYKNQMSQIAKKYPFDIRNVIEKSGYLEVYVSQRLESTTNSDILDAVGDVLGQVSKDEYSEWIAYDVEYLYGFPTRGENIMVIQSEVQDPFDQQGVWNIYCCGTEDTKQLIDEKGFSFSAPVYYMIQEDNISEFESDVMTYQSLYKQASISVDCAYILFDHQE